MTLIRRRQSTISDSRIVDREVSSMRQDDADSLLNSLALMYYLYILYSWLDRAPQSDLLLACRRLIGAFANTEAISIR